MFSKKIAIKDKNSIFEKYALYDFSRRTNTMFAAVSKTMQTQKIVVVAVSLTFFLAVFGSVCVYAAFAPVCHVVIDTDHAVELSLNRFHRVIVNRNYRDGGMPASAPTRLDGMTVSEAAEVIVRAACQAGQLDEDAKIGVFVTVEGQNELAAEALTGALTHRIDAALRTMGVQCRSAGMVCPPEFLAAGHNKDISPGRLCMISQLKHTYTDPTNAVYKRMVKYSSRWLMSAYAREWGVEDAVKLCGETAAV